MSNENKTPNKLSKIISKISFNSPVVLIFTIICFLAWVLGVVTNFASTNLLFSVYHSSFLSPFTYFRFIGHIFGHADFSHLMGNIMLILVIGPLLEEKYGGKKLILVMFCTALVTGIINFFVFPQVQLLGASGIVFAFILLSSFTHFKEGKIPVTFILVAVIYIGQEIYNGFFVSDNISNLTHIAGGIVGAGAGFLINKNKQK